LFVSEDKDIKVAEADMQEDPFMMEEEPYMEEEPFMQEDPDQKSIFFGLSPVEIGILVVLILVICGLAVFIGKSFLDALRAANAVEDQLPPTLTLAPSPTPKITSTPWPAAEPIPDWGKFEFAGSKASLWLPNSYQGGDPIAYPEIVMMTVEVFSSDQAFNQSVEEMISNNPALTFFAFDTTATESARIVFVIPEPADPDPTLTMDDYLDALMETARKDGMRLVGRDIIALDHFEAGQLAMEFRVPTGPENQYANVRMVVYLVQVDDTIWSIAYRTGREEFDDFLPVIETSINSFHVQP
jgi:hypothetical protein